MIDLQHETMLSLPEAARRLPPHRLGRPVHPSCVFRWVLDGIRTPSGERVRLEALRLGGRWLTSVEALQRFAEIQTPHLDGETRLAPRTSAQRRRASEKAAKELKKLRI